MSDIAVLDSGTSLTLDGASRDPSISAVEEARGGAATRKPTTQCLTSSVVFDWRKREIRHENGRRCELSHFESELLGYLLGKAGTPVSREEILACVWRLNPGRTVTRTIDMHVSFLRKKLGDDPRRPTMLLTVYRKGYMFRADATATL